MFGVHLARIAAEFQLDVEDRLVTRFDRGRVRWGMPVRIVEAQSAVAKNARECYGQPIPPLGAGGTGCAEYVMSVYCAESSSFFFSFFS